MGRKSTCESCVECGADVSKRLPSNTAGQASGRYHRDDELWVMLGELFQPPPHRRSVRARFIARRKSDFNPTRQRAVLHTHGSRYDPAGVPDLALLGFDARLSRCDQTCRLFDDSLSRRRRHLVRRRRRNLYCDLRPLRRRQRRGPHRPIPNIPATPMTCRRAVRRLTVHCPVPPIATARTEQPRQSRLPTHRLTHITVRSIVVKPKAPRARIRNTLATPARYKVEPRTAGQPRGRPPGPHLPTDPPSRHPDPRPPGRRRHHCDPASPN